MQDAADKAEKNADPLAEKATNKAGEAAHTAVKTTHQKWDEVKPEEKVDQAAEKASKTVQASLLYLGRNQSSVDERRRSFPVRGKGKGGFGGVNKREVLEEHI